MSSYNDCIKFALKIKDPSLVFSDKFFLGNFHNHDVKFYSATALLDHCLNCGSNNIVHNGHAFSHVRYAPSSLDSTDWLPEHLAFDEFRGVGRQLHFIAIDGHSHRVIKILPTRLKNDIIRYFRRFPIIVRRKVKTVTMDLNYYYDIMAKELFLMLR